MSRLHLLLVIFMVLFSWTVSAQEQESVETPAVRQAIALFQADDIDGALELLQTELVKEPDNAEIHNALGIVYMRKEQIEQAFEHFDKAIELGGLYHKAINNKFSFLMSMNRLEEGLELLSEILATYPEYLIGWQNKASLEMQMRDYQAALESITTAVELNPDDPRSLFKRGQIFLLQRKYAEAQSDFESALAAEPQFYQAREGVELVTEIREKLASGHIRVRQILVQNRALADEIHQQLESGASFVELAQQHNSGSAARYAGDLGLITKGDLLPALEEAMFSLEPGEFSQVIDSPAGFHIFLRVE